MATKFKVWKTITVGGKSKRELIDQIEGSGFLIGMEAKAMMEKESFIITPKPIRVDLVKTTVRDLGFDGANTRKIWDRIEERGGSLCPSDLAPHLLLAYKTQCNPDSDIFIAMKQIDDSSGCMCVFQLEPGVGCLWLDSIKARPLFDWFAPYREIAFVAGRT